MDEQWRKIERYAYFGIAVVLLILIVLSSISYRNLVHIQRDFRAVVNSRDVLIKLSYFISELKDAQTSQLEYMLVGDEETLEPYDVIHNNIRLYFVQLKTISATNKVQLERIKKLEKLVNMKLEELQQLVDLQQDKGVAIAMSTMKSNEGKEIMEDIQSMILEMDDDERVALANRDMKMSQRVRYDAYIKAAGISLIFLVTLLVITRINYWIVEYKKAQLAKQEAIEVKSHFVSMVSHELRTPLKAIKESISIVLEGSVGPISLEQEKFIDIAGRNVDRLAKLVDDVLDFQKTTQRQVTYEMFSNDINRVIEEVVVLLSPALNKKYLNFITELDGNLPGLIFDRDKIIQVLTNIINNAIKFAPYGDSIKISSKLIENVAIISVADNGIGIEKKYLEKIFDEFSQVPTDGVRHQGTGLGLAISKEIILHHNGKIWAESSSGEGTTIKFLLPIVERRNLERGISNAKENYSHCG